MHNHSHAPVKQGSARLWLSLLITLAFVCIEAVAGYAGHSLALLSDAGHNLTDVAALAITLYAAHLGSKSATSNRTFGYQRAGILAALLNSSTLILIAMGILYEAIHRLRSPEQVDTRILIGMGCIALAVNLGTALLIKKGSEGDLNLRSAYVHLMGDVASTIGAILAGFAIMATRWNWLDSVVSILIACLILWNVWGIIREVLDILLENAPRDVDMEALVTRINALPGVRGVHDLHVWSLNQSRRAMSAHILVDDSGLPAGIETQKQIARILAREFEIGHTTLQLEIEGCDSAGLHCQAEAPEHGVEDFEHH